MCRILEVVSIIKNSSAHLTVAIFHHIVYSDTARATVAVSMTTICCSRVVCAYTHLEFRFILILLYITILKLFFLIHYFSV